MNDSDRISIGVGAVVFKGDEALLIQRGKPPFEGQWSVPGGKLKFGERLHDAVRREVREETGIEIDIIGLIDVFEVTGSEEKGAIGGHIVLVDYVAEWVSGAPRAGDDAAAAEFVNIETAMARLSWDETRRALARALEIRKADVSAP